MLSVPGHALHVAEHHDQRGQARSHVRVDDSISPGVVFIPIHWNELWAESASPNEATNSQTDPISRQPALKCCAVRVEAVEAQPGHGRRRGHGPVGG